MNILKRLWRYIWRSSVTGEFVTKDFAKRNPRETVREKVEPHKPRRWR